MDSSSSAGVVGGTGKPKKEDNWAIRHFGWSYLGHGAYARPRIIHD
jgi:hypothetical protein